MNASLKRNLHPVWLQIIQNRQPEAAPSEVPAKPMANPALSYLIAMKQQETPSAMGSRHPGVDMTGWEVEQMPTRLGGPARQEARQQFTRLGAGERPSWRSALPGANPPSVNKETL